MPDAGSTVCIDFSQFKPDEPLKHVHTNAIQSAVEAFSTAGPNKVWTPNELACALTHETFIDVVDLLVPELQKRGVYKTEYAQGTLREKLFGEAARLPASHPGSGYRVLANVQGDKVAERA